MLTEEKQGNTIIYKNALSFETEKAVHCVTPGGSLTWLIVSAVKNGRRTCSHCKIECSLNAFSAFCLAEPYFP